MGHESAEPSRARVVRLEQTRDRGFGFLRAEGETVDRFFHHSDLRGGLTFDGLREGTEVTFEPDQGEKGPRAKEIYPA